MDCDANVQRAFMNLFRPCKSENDFKEILLPVKLVQIISNISNLTPS